MVGATDRSDEARGCGAVDGLAREIQGGYAGSSGGVSLSVTAQRL